jgi:hypothetical protein
MKKEELINKLESIDLPGADLEDHRRQLRAALLSSSPRPKPSRAGALGSMVLRMRAQADALAARWKSPHQFRRLAAVGAVATALIIVLLVVAPFFDRQSPAAQAAEIASNSTEVKEAFGDSDFRVVHVEMGTIPVVTFEGSSGTRVVAAVDMDSGKVTSVTVLSPPDMQKAIDIAMTDPAVQELVANGASFVDVAPVFFRSVVVTYNDGEEPVYYGDVIQGQVVATLQQGKQRWAVDVDLVEGKVLGDVMKL